MSNSLGFFIAQLHRSPTQSSNQQGNQWDVTYCRAIKKRVIIPQDLVSKRIHLSIESVAHSGIVTLIPIYREKCLNFIKDEILLRRNPSDILLRSIQNDIS